MASRSAYSTWTPQKPTLFNGHYLRKLSTLDIGVLGYIGIVQHKEHSPEVFSIPSGTPCICKTRLASNEILSPSNRIHREVGRAKDLSAPLYDIPQQFSVFCMSEDRSDPRDSPLGLLGPYRCLILQLVTASCLPDSLENYSLSDCGPFHKDIYKHTRISLFYVSFISAVRESMPDSSLQEKQILC